MFENEDMILPDDFNEEEQTTQPEVEEETNETVSEEVDANETEQTEDEMTQEDKEQIEGMTEKEKQTFLKIKYNKEEIELDEDKAKELAEMGMNYPKIKERLESLENDPRLSFVEQLAKENNMTVEQYIDAAREYQEQQKIKALAEKEGVSEEIAKRLYDLEKRDQERSQKEKQQEEQLTKKEQQEKDFQDFLSYFKDNNGREYDPNKDSISDEVWKMVEQGKSLVDAYAIQENQKLKEQLKILKQNQENSKKAVGSVTEHGSESTKGKDPFELGFDSV